MGTSTCAYVGNKLAKVGEELHALLQLPYISLPISDLKSWYIVGYRNSHRLFDLALTNLCGFCLKTKNPHLGSLCTKIACVLHSV